MQINPFGYPLGAGMQSASANDVASLGFVDALGVAIEGGAPQLIGLKASVTPPRILDAKLSQTLLAQAQLDAQPAPVVPGFQQPTSLSQLMATAATVPAADSMPAAEPATPGAQPATMLVAVTPARPATTAIATTSDVEAEPAAAPSQPVVPKPAAVPSQVAPEAQPESEALPYAPKSVEAMPTKPQKGPRVRAAGPDPDLALPADAKLAVPANMVAAAVAPQPVVQPQSVPREAAAPQTGNATPAIRKIVATGAPAETVTQAASGATTDFAGAIAARSDSTGSDANADSQAQPEARLAAAGKPEAAAPQFPLPAQATASADPVHAGAPAVAEPVIEARAGHLGQSLGVEIARKVELGEETLRIRLNPVELGRVEVTLAFDDKGSLQATVRTESAQAMDLLRQDAPDLARTLDQAGVRTDAQSFRFENRGGDGGGQQAQQQQNRGQLASSDDDAAIAEPIYRPIRSDGQVDLLA
jgi:flagellar hook-length control protein FliK